MEKTGGSTAVKNIPEKCCANCKYLLTYDRGNAYGDADYLCIRLGRFLTGIYKDLDKAAFYQIGEDTPDLKAAAKCKFER